MGEGSGEVYHVQIRRASLSRLIKVLADYDRFLFLDFLTKTGHNSRIRLEESCVNVDLLLI